MMFLKKEDFGQAVRTTPLISIDFIVENEVGEFLVGRRKNKPAQGYWFVPGGRVLKDEKLGHAFARLSEEELGQSLSMDKGSFFGVWEHFYDDNFCSDLFTTHYVVIGFRLNINSQEWILPSKQHDTWRWITPEEIYSDELVHPNTRAYFDSDLQNQVPGI